MVFELTRESNVDPARGEGLKKRFLTPFLSLLNAKVRGESNIDPSRVGVAESARIPSSL